MNVDSIGTKLAILILETEQAHQQVDRALLEGARRDFTEALNDEVEALHDQADAQFRGAIVEAALTMASGGLAAVAAGLECDGKEVALAGKSAGDLAKPLGTLAGHDYGGADAKRAQGELQQARWEIDDLRDNLDRADGAQNEALDWSASLVESDAATTRSVLSNLA